MIQLFACTIAKMLILLNIYFKLNEHCLQMFPCKWLKQSTDFFFSIINNVYELYLPIDNNEVILIKISP